MYKTTLNQTNSTEENKSTPNPGNRDQISMSKEDANSKAQMSTMNFWGRGSYYDELNFFELNSL